MRIIGGIHKGKRITAPKNLPVRPTTDFAKEGLCNILSHEFNFEHIAVLDLFCGTGNISFEMASRGAKSVRSIDQNFGCISFVKKKASELELHQIKAFKNSVKGYLTKFPDKFDLIFADPPYDMKGLDEIVTLIFEKGLLNDGAWFVLEHDRNWDFTAHEHFLKHKSYGNVHFSIFQN